MKKEYWLTDYLRNNWHIKEDRTIWPSELSAILANTPDILYKILWNTSETDWIWFTEISQSIFAIDKETDIDYVDSNFFLNTIKENLPELGQFYPNIFKKIDSNIHLARIIAVLINSYKEKKLGLIYVPWFHRSLYWPFEKDILPHVIPLLWKSPKENINIEYPWNWFVKMGWNVFKEKDTKEFNELFDAEEYEFLIYLFLKFSESLDTIFAHSLWPIFIVKAMEKLKSLEKSEKNNSFNCNKIKNIIFLNPALNQDKLSKFWFLQNYLSPKNTNLEENKKTVLKYIDSNHLKNIKWNEKIIIKEKFKSFLEALNKKNTIWFDFLDLFFDNSGDFLLENFSEWKDFSTKNNISYVNYAFSTNFVENFNDLWEEILDKVSIISLEGYSTVPFDSLRNRRTEKSVKCETVYIPLETHYWNTAEEVEKLRKIIGKLISI
ncbi:MAG: hypothetical protein ACD_4C00256G0004 [uncultured bacterium (gcode 4)]|uniref:Uncharacterized protein n=1 Tax=uncultured bacterium (gcode 4) TaxID=1234023 RepID=K2FXB8_9BACT|nr:MAG: hypothetical protein ACD_4C00256G0004 [uncultured bacterium (gcode 4)]